MTSQNCKKVVLGGTFDVLHKGHEALLKKAFSLGEVTIGLTSDKMARKLKRRKVNLFKERKLVLEKFIKKNFSKRFQIIKIEDKFGPTLKKEFDYIVVSPETYPGAVLINKERKKRKKRPIKIVKIKFVLGRDGKRISATKILKSRKK